MDYNRVYYWRRDNSIWVRVI